MTNTEELILATSQEEGLELLKAGKSAFVTGAAGTGKSYIIGKFKEWAANNSLKVAYTATTGIGARNIDGLTIHQMMGLGMGPRSEYGDYESNMEYVERIVYSKSYTSLVAAKLQALDTIIIDEVSMLTGRLFDCINLILKKVRKNTRPFGGIQMIVTGDFLQLPPVSKFGSSIDWAFNSNAWINGEFNFVNLTKSYRQADQKFIDLLNGARIGNITEEQCEELNNCVRPAVDDSVYLTTHKKQAEDINNKKLEEIDSAEFTFFARTEGNDKEVKFLLANLTSPECLNIKAGARAILTVNDKMGRYFNGSSCTVTAVKNNDIKVKLDKTGEELLIAPVVWDNTNYAPASDFAAVTQYPLKLGWAITIHGAQGMTLENAYIDIRKVFAEGQTYVALSRLKTLAGVCLSDWRTKSLKTNKAALEFYKYYDLI